MTGLLAHQPRTHAIPKWAIPSAQRNANFTWSGQLRGNGMVQEVWAVQTVIAQAGPGSKGSTPTQRFPIKDSASGLDCGKISAGSGVERCRKNAGPTHQIGFERDILRISSRIAWSTEGRPGLPARLLRVQNRLKPSRCQRITVAG